MSVSACVFLVLLSVLSTCLALSRADPQVDNLIMKYWNQYKKIAVILAYLRIVHKVSIGMTYLKKRLKSLNLHRRGVNVKFSSVSQIQAAIEKELRGYNGNIGYRRMWSVLKEKHGLTVKRSTVQMLLSIVDGEGVKRRRARKLKRRIYQNKGPDFVWHIDGYDKLKPYGFTIHGCIDGYSRKIIWLEVATTNNDPKRIESWWAQLRNSCTDWWINLFKDFIQSGEFNPNINMHKQCLAFVYLPLLKQSLQEFVSRWNNHTIRPNRMAGCPSGVPEDLYQLPEITGTRSYKQPLDYLTWSHCFLFEASKAPSFYDEKFDDIASAILLQSSIRREDITIETARAVYTYLRSELDE